MADTSMRRAPSLLVGLGALGLLGAVVFAESRSLLIALGFASISLGLLLAYLVIDPDPAASVATALSTAYATNLVATLDDADFDGRYRHVYRASAATTDDEREYELLVPREVDSAMVGLSDPEALSNAARERGRTLYPVGGPLLRETESVVPGGLSGNPKKLAAELLDGLTDQLEIVERARMSVRENTARVEIAGVAYGPATSFDHPAPSFLGVGFAAGVGSPVVVDVTPAEGDATDFLVVCRWNRSRSG